MTPRGPRALSTEEAIAYVQRGRGERKRPAKGWASLTPAERDVVRLVSEGLGTKDIATRLFVSPRVYSKLGVTSRRVWERAVSAADVLAGWLDAIRAAPELPLAACRGSPTCSVATPAEDQSPASS